MYLAGMGTYLMYKEMRGLTTLVSTAFCILLAFSYLWGYISILQILLVIVPPFLATVPLYLSNFRDRERMVEVADVIYHRVLVTIYMICILVLLFLR